MEGKQINSLPQRKGCRTLAQTGRCLTGAQAYCPQVWPVEEPDYGNAVGLAVC
jgi:hypothetical protein